MTITVSNNEAMQDIFQFLKDLKNDKPHHTICNSGKDSIKLSSEVLVESFGCTGIVSEMIVESVFFALLPNMQEDSHPNFCIDQTFFGLTYLEFRIV